MRIRWLGALACAAVLASGGSAAAATSPTVAARQHFFGTENVDPATGAVRDDRVILSWFGISSLALAIEGHVVLLDAYINNVNNATPTQDDVAVDGHGDRKSTRLNSSHMSISYAVFCLKKKKKTYTSQPTTQITR